MTSKVRKLLVTDIRCRTCNAGPGERCRQFVGLWRDGSDRHGERIAEHAELERAGWEWQEVDQVDAGAGREERETKRKGWG